MNMDRIEERKNKQRSLIIQFSYCILFLSFLFFFLTQKGGFQKIKSKDYFVLDSHLFNQWIEAYSGSESWGSTAWSFLRT